MSVLSAHREMHHRVLGYFGGGGTATLRRRHSLITQSTGLPPATLQVNGAQLAGVATLNLKGGTTLSGVLVAGCKFTIAGNATAYTVGTATTASSTGTLIAVPISPVLAANAADLAVVTITQAYGDYSFVRQHGDGEIRDEEGAIRAFRGVLHLSAHGATVSPVQGDLLVEENETIAWVSLPKVGGGAVQYAVAYGALA